jgi:hypothetical protein
MVTGIWLSADAALQHVLAHELVPDAAKTKLENKVRNGEIPAKAALLNFLGAISSDAVIPADFWDRQWRHISIDFTNDTARSRVFSPALRPAESGSGMVLNYLSDDSATGVAFSKRHLFSIWPDTETKASGFYELSLKGESQ